MGGIGVLLLTWMSCAVWVSITPLGSPVLPVECVST